MVPGAVVIVDVGTFDGIVDIPGIGMFDGAGVIPAIGMFDGIVDVGRDEGVVDAAID